MSPDPIETTVFKVLSVLLNKELSVGDEVNNRNTEGWDSLKHVEIMFALEEELNVEFSEEELGQLDSAAKIINAVRAKHAS